MNKNKQHKGENADGESRQVEPIVGLKECKERLLKKILEINNKELNAMWLNYELEMCKYLDKINGDLDIIHNKI